MFNPIRYTQELERAGLTRDQAEVGVKILADVMNENFATKSDLKEVELILRSDMKEMETSIRSDMKEMETSIRSDMRAMETSIRADIQSLSDKLTIKLGAMLAASVGAIAALNSFLLMHVK